MYSNMKTKLQKTIKIFKSKYQRVLNIFKKYKTKVGGFVITYPSVTLLIVAIAFGTAVSFVKILDKTVKRRTMPIEYLVVHYTANFSPKASAKMNAIYLKNAERAGTHYCVDDLDIIQCTEEYNVAYAVGDRRWAGFIPKFWLNNKVKNNNSLSFEMCLGGGRNDSLILDRTAQALGWQLVNKGLGLDHIVRHHDVTGKHCPRFCYTDEKWDQKREDAQWAKFLKLVDKYHKIQLWRKKMAKERALESQIQTPTK